MQPSEKPDSAKKKGIVAHLDQETAYKKLGHFRVDNDVPSLSRAAEIILDTVLSEEQLIRQVESRAKKTGRIE